MRRIAMPLLLSLSLLLSGCQNTDEASSSSTPAPADTEPVSVIDPSDLFSDRDLDGSYDESTAIPIQLTGETAVCTSDAVSIDGTQITLLDEGTYLVSGSLTDGQIVVDADDTDKVQIVLAGAAITCADSAAIYSKNADKVFLTLAEGTENTLTNGGSYTAIDENNIDAVVFSKTDLTLNGSGNLTIDAQAGHGVVSKDELTVTGGGYTVTTADGLKNVAKLVNEEGKTDINITLDTDLTLTGEWTPIGTSFGNSYTGTFDGGGHTITGLTVNQKERGTVGLIGDLGSGGKVQNLTLENVNLNGNLYVGSVVGYSNNGTVTACTASGSINGKEYVGGIVGSNYLGTVTACYNTSSTVNGSYLVGGVVGQNNKGIVTACYNASGSIYGEGTVGGVVGDNYTSTVTACYWSNYAGYGIGNGSTEGATKVDGTVTWQTAVDAMNTALQNAGSEWRYELTGELPTLKK